MKRINGIAQPDADETRALQINIANKNLEWSFSLQNDDF